ncbi:23S rRNA pseudouridine(955/2504/2580) synthase RluC [Methylomarinovum caldicuralii]|nr:23S rRNA pseudouridine(955/2504/2580) synthase RluC [Methylomarinovum caldicuralii]
MKGQVSDSARKIPPRQIEIDADEAGQRIDNFLFARLKGVPKSRIYRMLRTGEVRVNRGRVKAPYRLQAGDMVRLPPVQVAAAGPPAPPGNRPRRLETRIVYEDEDLLVLDKPAGMAVHGGSGLAGGVIEALRAVRPQARFLELVHRLDRDTSGCLLIAKRRSVLRALHAQLRSGRVEKRYLALLEGEWRGRFQRVDVPLRKFVLQGGERLVKAAEDGKPSQTLFRRLEAFPQATLVEAELLTGRTHQIRVHAAWLGHPLAGDERYGDKAANRRWRRLGLKRLFLHAWQVAFRHPRRDVMIRLEAPLDGELEALLDHLRQP